MSAVVDITDSSLGDDKRGHKPRERRCIVTGDTLPPEQMLRFVSSPDGQVTPDLYNKLPGRGTWVTSERSKINQAIKTGAFKRGFKTNVNANSDLAETISSGLSKQLLSLIGMAMKSGQLSLGFDQVRMLASTEYLAWRIEASDGSADSRSKIRVLTKAMSHELERPQTPVIGCFTASELGMALGRERIVHAGLKSGAMSKALTRVARRLKGFKDLVPLDWPDRSHETEFGSEISRI